MASGVEHRGRGRGADQTGLLIGQPAGGVVGRGIGVAEALHDPAGGHADQVGGGQRLAAAPHHRVDQPEMGMDPAQPVGGQGPSRLGRLLERRDHDVRVGQQPVDQVPRPGRVEVERQAALAGVVQQVAQAALGIESVSDVRPGDPQCVAGRGLNADHLRAEVRQEAARETQALVAEVDDDRPGQGERGCVHQGSLGS